MDEVYSIPFTRQAHPKYGSAEIPALTVIRNSVQIVRGCFGGCSFCSIAAHEGKIIQSRSCNNVLDEIRRMQSQPGFTGVISDLGGPTANSYQMTCRRPEQMKRCRRTSCLYPKICPNLNTDHTPVIELMESARKIKGVKRRLLRLESEPTLRFPARNTSKSWRIISSVDISKPPRNT